MPLSILELNTQLKALSNQSSVSAVVERSADMVSQYTAATSTTLGFNVNEVVGGWQSLTQTVDNPLGQTSTTNPPIVMATSSVEKEAGTPPTISGGEQDDINAILDQGSSSAGFLHEVVTLGTPEAIAAASGNVWGATTSQINSMLSSVSPATIDIDVAVDGLLNKTFSNSFFNQVGIFQSSVTTLLNNLNSLNKLKNITEYLTGDIKNSLLSIADIVNDTVIFNATIDVLNNNKQSAVDKMASLIILPTSLTQVASQQSIKINIQTESDLINFLEIMEILKAPQSDIDSVYSKLGSITTLVGVMSGSIDFSLSPTNTSIQGTIAPAPTEDKIYTITSTTNSSDTDFSYIDSLEEMIADLRAITREVTTTVVHWTANFIDDHYVDANHIKQVHLTRGFSTIGYHYLIRTDGSIQRGRNPNIVGAHAKSSHNPYSLGIGIVGGYNCPNGTSNPDNYVSPDSINAAQWNTLDMFLKAFYTIWPGGEVWGHWQVNTDKIDPMVDMGQYVQNKFNKTNISPQPTRSYSTTELANRTFDSF